MTDYNNTEKRTVFLNEKEGQYGKYYSGKKEDVSYFVNPKEDGSISVKIDGEVHIPNANGNGEGYNFVLGNERVFVNMGKSEFGPYAKLDFVANLKKSPEDEGTPKVTASKTYNKKKF